MTICKSMIKAVDTRLDNGKKIGEIGKELCDGVKNPDRKIIRIIKEIDGKGEKYLIENGDKIGFTGVTQLRNAIERREKKKDNPTATKKKAQKIGLEKTEEEKPHNDNEQMTELIKKYHDRHPQDWKEIIMEFIKDIEDKLSQNPIEEPENSSGALESETTPTSTEEQEQASAGEK